MKNSYSHIEEFDLNNNNKLNNSFIKFKFNDGGKSKYFKGTSGDCAVRALSILLNKDYKDTYKLFNTLNIIGESPRNGNTLQKIYDVYTKQNLIYIDLNNELDIDYLTKFNFIIQYAKHLHTCLNSIIQDIHQKY